MARLLGSLLLAIGLMHFVAFIVGYLVDQPKAIAPVVLSSLVDGLCFAILGSVLLLLNWLRQRKPFIGRRRCPNDAMLIPKVAEACAGAEPVRFFWCRSCMELFALVGETSGGRWAASFGQDFEAGGWKLWKASGSERDVQLSVDAVSRVPPQR